LRKPIEARISRKLILGERIHLTDAVDMELLGNAIHRFIAADDWLSSPSNRSDMAQRIIRNWSITDSISASDLVEISNRLKQVMEREFPGALWHRECPVAGRIGIQRVKGSIDLFLELEDSYVIVDHKTFPGRFELWETKAVSHYPQLAAYKNLIEQNSTKPVSALFIHMPIVGSLLQLESGIHISLQA
jgi:ATP-dependent exoDNAse (exonuclease V) beta subunit